MESVMGSHPIRSIEPAPDREAIIEFIRRFVSDDKYRAFCQADPELAVREFDPRTRKSLIRMIAHSDDPLAPRADAYYYWC